jgi:hypothetical protein
MRVDFACESAQTALDMLALFVGTRNHRAEKLFLRSSGPTRREPPFNTDSCSGVAKNRSPTY